VPELPELEVIKTRLAAEVVGRTVTRAELRHPACLKTVEPALDELVGRKFAAVSRLGKFTVLGFGDWDLEFGVFLCVHLMLDGAFALVPSSRKPTKNHLLVLGLDDKRDLRVTESGTKHRVAVHLARQPRDVPQIAAAGLDPLSAAFTLDAFRTSLAEKNQTLKSFLCDGRLITGIGNCYSDEILHAARLSPFALTGRIREPDAARLFDSVGAVLRDAIARLSEIDHLPDRRDRTFLRVHGRKDKPCPACGEAVRWVSYAESNTCYCPNCQTGGKPLADRRMSRLLK
jgi:formamidopyrimidine-DNA glycosylase